MLSKLKLLNLKDKISKIFTPSCFSVPSSKNKKIKSKERQDDYFKGLRNSFQETNMEPFSLYEKPPKKKSFIAPTGAFKTPYTNNKVCEMSDCQYCSVRADCGTCFFCVNKQKL